MAVTDQQKIDFLLKKIGFTKTKTGSVVGTGAISGTPKQPFAEAIPSPLIIANGALWNESDSIPTTPPGSDTAQVKVYLAGTSGLRMTADATSSGQRAYIAYSTYGNASSARLTNWIDTQFGSGYLIKVYKGDPNSGGVALSAAGSGSNDGWFFDYSAGVLNFNDTSVPSGVTDTNIYIVGYRYIGLTGAPTPGISTFSNFDLTVERNLDVGKQGGISTFRHNVQLLDNDKLQFGDSQDLEIYHDSNHSYIDDTGTGNLKIRSGTIEVSNLAGSKTSAVFNSASSQDLYFNNTKRFETTNTGVSITGNVSAVDGTFSGNVSAVDATFTGNVSIAGTLTYEDAKNVDSVGLITARSGIRVTGGVIEAQAGENKIPALYANLGALPNPGTYHGMFAHVHSTGRGYFSHAGGWYELVNVESNGVVGTGTQRYNLGALVSTSTTATSLNVVGVTTAVTVDINGDLDVDGHTNLDNVSIAGVTTFASVIEGVSGENKIPSLYSNMGALPNPSTYHGMFAHVHSTGRGYFSHAGGWYELVNRESNGNVGTGTERYSIGTLVSTSSTVSTLNVTGVSTFAGEIDANGRIVGAQLANVIPFYYDNTSQFPSASTYHGAVAHAHNTGRLYFAHAGWKELVNVESNGVVGTGTQRYNIGALVSTSTTATSLNVSGVTTAVTVDVNGDLDVDGHTNLDNVSIAGFTTITQDLDVDGHTNLDNVSVAGVTTFGANTRFNSTIGVHDGTTGGNGQYLRATGTGVTWGSFPTMRTSQTFTASSGQTSFSFTYNVGYLDVYVNGVKLTTSEFTANNGQTVVLSVGSFVGDIVELVSYFTTSYAAGEPGITELVQDPTPQLGGNLDLFNKSITGTGNVNITGIITATSYVGDGSGLTNVVGSGSGVVIRNSGSVVGTAGTIDFGDNLSVTPISAGIVTITGSAGGGSGISTISGIVNIVNDLDVDGHTNLDNVSIAGVTTTSGLLDINAGGQANTFKVEDLTDNRIVIAGTGGELEDSANLTFNGSTLAVSGSQTISELLDVDGHTELDNVNIAGVVTTSDIRSNSLNLKNAAGSATYATFSNGGAAVLKWNNTDRLETTTSGVTVTGTVAATAYTGDGSQLTGINASGISTISGVVSIVNDLDVDGHTNLDNVNIAGVVTATTVNATTFNGSFVGNGSGLTGVVASGSGIVVKDDGSNVGTAGTINFTEPITVTPLSAGITTVGINTVGFSVNNFDVSGIASFAQQINVTGDLNLALDNGTIRRNSKLLFQAGNGNPTHYAGTPAGGKGDHIFRTFVGGFSYERFRIGGDGDIGLNGENYGTSGQVLTSNGAGAAASWTTVSGGGGTNVGITTNLSGSFTASAGTAATINTLTGYSANDLVVEYTIYIKNGSDFQTQKLLAMRDGTTIHSTQFAVMFSSSLLVQCDATISSGNILLRATPETGVSGSTTYKIKREVM